MILLPKNISSNGQEIWDWAARLGKISLLQHEISSRREQLRSVLNRCGGCTKWMIPYCPREKHDNKKGHSVGPNMNTYICGQYDMTQSTAELIERLEKEINEYTQKLTEAK